MNLITGGTGLVGAHLLYNLLDKGETVRAIFRDESSLEVVRQIFDYYPRRELFNQIEWIKGDLLDPLMLEEALIGITDIYHCAAIVSFDPNDREELMKTNIDGTANVVNLALEKSIRKLCYVSSIGAFGRAKRNEKVNEETEWQNDLTPSGYSISKFHAELEVWRGIEEGLNAVIVNPSTIIGSGNWHRGSAAIVDRVYKGLPYYTNGTNGYVDVLDVVEIMIVLMKGAYSRERYLLVSENRNYLNFLSEIALNLGKQPPSIKVGRNLAQLAKFIENLKSLFRPGPKMITSETINIALDQQEYSNDKVRQKLNYTFRPLSDTIKRVCQDYLKSN